MIDLIGAIRNLLSQVVKLTGSVTSSTTTANWNSAEANLVQIGADNIKNKLHSLLIDIDNTAGNLTVKLYMQINGVERELLDYRRIVSKATNGSGIWVITGSLAIHEVLRVSIQSDAVADDAKSIGYDYTLESM